MFHQTHIREIWKKEKIAPFNEMLLTPNAKRPEEGEYEFFVKLELEGRWTEWLKYMSWSSHEQKGVSVVSKDMPVRVYQDAVEVMDGKRATGFQIRTSMTGDALLKDVYALHVYTNADRKEQINFDAPIESISLKVKGLSQMALDHPRAQDLCSPTSTTAVISYLLGNANIDPVLFAQNVWDGKFNIFGNWVMNVAEGASLLGSKWNGWVQRFPSFLDLYKHLKKGVPVVVSIRGPLPGGAQTYSRGHLLVIRGYDVEKGHVLCMDPAFKKNCETQVSYPYESFLEAWARRGNVAYVFEKKI